MVSLRTGIRTAAFLAAMAFSAFSSRVHAQPAAGPSRSEAMVSFTRSGSVSLEPLMLTKDARAADDLLTLGLGNWKPETTIGRTGRMATAFYGQRLVTNLAHETAHYAEAGVFGRKGRKMDFIRMLLLMPSSEYSPEETPEGFREDQAVTGRGFAINLRIANETLRRALSSDRLGELDALIYAVDHLMLSTPVADKPVYYDVAADLHGSGSPEERSIRKHALRMAVWNALDPYSIFSLVGVACYLAQGQTAMTLPPVWAPQLNGYLGVPGPLYEAAWYLPARGAVFSAAIRGGTAPETSGALRLGVDHLPLGRRLELSALVEGIRQAGQNGAFAHAGIGFPVGPLSVGPTVSYKTAGIWSPFAYGFEENLTLGVLAGYSY